MSRALLRPMLPMRALLTLMLAWLLAAAQPARAEPFVPSGQPAPELSASIVTFQPGTLYWQRFGHNALVLREAASGRAISFNYGIFDFAAPGFFLNFARGHMTYRVVPNTLDNDLLHYRAEHRWALEQRLNLDPRQVGRLRDFLAWNVQPENADYRYDYFLSNCSTRVRDALDYAMDGQLKPQLEARPSPLSFRKEATRLIAPDALLMAGMDLALGPIADRPISVWQQSFAPLTLMQALRSATVTDAGGRSLPLVSHEARLLPGGHGDTPDRAPDLRLQFLLAGITMAAILLGLARFRAVGGARAVFVLITTGIALACGLAGLILVALWAFSAHWAGWRNENLLLVNPLCLLLIPALAGYLRLRWRPTLRIRRLALAIAVLALLSLLVRELPGLRQQNLHWIYLLLPIHAVIALVFLRAKQPDEAL